MTKANIGQPGSTPEENQNTRLAEQIYTKCLSGVYSLGGERRILEQMGSDPVMARMMDDVEMLTLSKEDIISEYQRAIDAFFQELIRNRFDPHKERIEMHFASIVRMYVLPKIVQLARTKRAKVGENANKDTTLESIKDKWRSLASTRYAGRGAFISLAPPKKKSQRTDAISKSTSIGLQAITPETGVPVTPPLTKTAPPPPTTPAPKAPESNDEAPEPFEPNVKSTTGTIYGIDTRVFQKAATKQPEPKPKPAPSIEEAQEPVRISSEEQVPLAQIDFGTTTPEPDKKEYPTDPGLPGAESTDVHPVMSSPTDPAMAVEAINDAIREAAATGDEPGEFPIIIDTLGQYITDEDDGYDRALADREKAEADQYNNPSANIKFLYDQAKEANHARPPERGDWLISLRNFHTAMETSFSELGKEIAASAEYDDGLQQKTLQCLGTAFSMVGTPQFRKATLHHFHNTVRTNNDPQKRAKMMQIFEIALSGRPEFKQPTKPNERMQRIHEHSETKPAKGSSPSAFSLPHELDDGEIAEMPIEMQSALRILHTTAQNFGLNQMPMSGGQIPQTIASMRAEDFELQCSNTLRMLRNNQQKVKVGFGVSSWGGKKKKAREFLAKLEKVITEQIAIMEQLLFSPDLFIPPETKVLS